MYVCMYVCMYICMYVYELYSVSDEKMFGGQDRTGQGRTRQGNVSGISEIGVIPPAYC